VYGLDTQAELLWAKPLPVDAYSSWRPDVTLSLSSALQVS
jgi:hypothetical protein